MSDAPFGRLRIRDLDLGRGLMLAPMAGISDSPVRRLARRFGADLVCGEMAAAQGLAMVKRAKPREKLLEYVKSHPEERPFSAQLFGREPTHFIRAAQMALEAGADLIDINAGCPVRKVVSGGSGAALMRDLPLLGRIVETVRSVGAFPLTVKIRLGWDAGSMNYMEAGRLAVEAGADAVILHARTRSQMFEGAADWTAIARLAEALEVPVIGNGDVRCPEDALRMLRSTGCAGVMIGRGACGRPWLFNQIKAAMDGVTPMENPSPMEMYPIIIEHFGMLASDKGERRACLEIRKHLMWYTRGLPGSASLRRVLYALVDARGVLETARAFLEKAQMEQKADAQNH